MAKLLSLPADQPGSIVFVDDEVELVLPIGEMLRAEFGDARVCATSDPREASAWLRASRPAVLITDVRMPGHSGLELITQLTDTWGPTPTVVISAFPTDDVTVSARRSAVAYLPKPFKFAALLETVHRLLASSEETFQGAVVVSTLTDILQLYAISGATGMIAVSSVGREGEIWFDRGQITHAVSGDLEGFESFRDQISWPKGSFAWHSRRVGKQTIHMSVSALLMEANRLNEEAADVTRRTAHPPALEPEEAPRAHPTLNGLTANEVAAALDFALAPLPDLGLEAALDPPPQAVSELDEALTSSAGPLLHDLSELDGFLSASVVDSDQHAPVNAWSVGDDPHATSEGNAQLLGLLRATVENLDLHDQIEDVVLTMGSHYHLIRPLRSRPQTFLYLALDRERSNLALARLKLAVGENDLAV